LYADADATHVRASRWVGIAAKKPPPTPSRGSFGRVPRRGGVVVEWFCGWVRL